MLYLKVSEFELQLLYYVQFRANIAEKKYEPSVMC